MSDGSIRGAGLEVQLAAGVAYTRVRLVAAADRERIADELRRNPFGQPGLEQECT